MQHPLRIAVGDWMRELRAVVVVVAGAVVTCVPSDGGAALGNRRDVSHRITEMAVVVGKTVDPETVGGVRNRASPTSTCRARGPGPVRRCGTGRRRCRGGLQRGGLMMQLRI